jgi:hypothetical protein
MAGQTASAGPRKEALIRSAFQIPPLLADFFGGLRDLVTGGLRGLRDSGTWGLRDLRTQGLRDFRDWAMRLGSAGRESSIIRRGLKSEVTQWLASRRDGSKIAPHGAQRRVGRRRRSSLRLVGAHRTRASVSRRPHEARNPEIHAVANPLNRRVARFGKQEKAVSR